MLDDIRRLYLKALVETIVKPKFAEYSPEEFEDIRMIIENNLEHFETRLKNSLTDASSVENVYLELSPFEAFKHKLRDTEEYVMHKHRERFRSRLSSSNGSASDSNSLAPLQALQEYHVQLVEGLRLQGSMVLDQLVQDRCLDDDDVDSIRCKPTDKLKNEQLLHILATRLSGDMVLKSFVPALKSDHKHLAEGYMKVFGDICYPLAKRCPHCRLKGKVDPRCVVDVLYSRNVVTENELRDLKSCNSWTDEKWDRILTRVSYSVLVDALESKYPDFHRELIASSDSVILLECTCCDNPDSISLPSSGVFESTEKTIEEMIPAYPMSSPTRGICVIIHNTEYTQEKQAAMDINTIDRLFSDLDFSVERITNLTKRHILIRLKDIAVRDHSCHDAFVCVIALGGRDRDHVCDVSAESVHIAYLVEPFRARCCPSLAGKPKIFMLPYASGPKRTPGLVIKERDPLSHMESRKTVIPEDSDVLYSRGTLPGYKTSSCKKTGSWFLNNLKDVMDRYGDTLDFVTCLAMVNEGVGRVEYTKNDITYTQSSQVTSSLRKALYLKKRPRSRSTAEAMEHVFPGFNNHPSG